MSLIHDMQTKKQEEIAQNDNSDYSDFFVDFYLATGITTAIMTIFYPLIVFSYVDVLLLLFGVLQIFLWPANYIVLVTDLVFTVFELSPQTARNLYLMFPPIYYVIPIFFGILYAYYAKSRRSGDNVKPQQ
jgi:hypothetical protein